MRPLAGVVCAVLVLVAAVAHGKATVVIVNADDAGVGFNDPTPVAPVGGNCGTTLGAQRLVVFRKAAEIWGNRLDSAAPITILSHFVPLTCSSSGATLGSAGPTNIFASDDPTLPSGIPASVFPKPHTWYVSALVGAFAGQPVVPGTGTAATNYDILANFNSALDNPNASCSGFRWYYGLDNDHGGQLDLLTVVLHEFGHGLGFISFANPSTGAFPNNEPDIWASYLYDKGSGKHWVELTDATRATSAISGALAWDGPTVIQTVPEMLELPPLLRVTSAPNSPSVVKDYAQIAQADFTGPIPEDGGVTGPLGVGSTGFGCSSQGRLAPLDGMIAILDRGGPNDAGCTFVEKARNAQDAGAIGLLIANNTTNPALIFPSGTAPDVIIPVLLITQTDGTSLKQAVGAGPVQAEIIRDASQSRLGADSADRALMYAPTTLSLGSSVSHWDLSAFPHLLMEPEYHSDLTHTLDMTPALLQDTGWTISDAGAIPDGSDPLVCPASDAGADAGGGADGGGGGGGSATGGCTTALGSPAPWLALLGLLALVRRRRRA